jgi:uncharacterized protein YfaS (alpha-2-macroglobulin family)
MEPSTTPAPENAFYFEIEEHEIPEPEPIIPEVASPAPAEEANKSEAEESAKPAVEEPAPVPEPEPVKEPVVDEPAPSEPKPKKKKEKAPLKPEVPLSIEELDNVLSKLPETMQEALAEANEEGKYVFRGASDVKPPATRGASVSRKVFPPPPPTEAELQAAKLAREQQELQKTAIQKQTLAPVHALREPEEDGESLPPGAPPSRSVASTSNDKKAQKAAEQQAKEAQKAADKLAKDEAKAAEAAKKAEEQAKKDAAAALKAAEKARLEAEALAAQEKAEREIFRVENYLPEGNLSSKTLKRIVITFNHPLEKKVVQGEPTDEPTFVPKVTPAPPAGHWSVSGETDNALVFEVEDEAAWPLSTKFTVKIVAGSLGAQNRPLAQELVFHFTTPTLRLTHMFPDASAKDVSPLAPIVLVFDQPVDLKLLLQGKHKQLVVKRYDGTEIELERTEDVEHLMMLQDAHKAEDHYTRHIHVGNAECHWIALLPKNPMPRGASITINLDTELTSMLGPVKSREPALSQYFNTRTAFQVNSATINSDEDTISINFSWPLCDAKQDLSDFTWRPNITPTPPSGYWTINQDRNGLSFRTDAHVKFVASTEYIVTLPDGIATSKYAQPLERNESLSKWAVGPLPQLNVDVKSHHPAEIFWWSFVTTLNRVVRWYPENGAMIRGNCIFMLETSQPIDEADLVRNVTFYCRKSGLVAGLTSIVKKEKPHGACEVVSWNSIAENDFYHWQHQSWEWDRHWSGVLNPRHYYAFKCTLDLPNDQDIEVVLGPHLPSLIGPVPAVIEEKRKYWLPGSGMMSTPRFIFIRNREALSAICPVVQKQLQLAQKINSSTKVHFATASVINADDFEPTSRTVSGLAEVKPDASRVSTLQLDIDSWQRRHDDKVRDQAAALQSHQTARQNQQNVLDQHKQALLQHAQATRAALKAGQPAPSPVAPLNIPYVTAHVPQIVTPRKSGDLPTPTALELVTPFQPRHVLIVPFTRNLVHDPHLTLDWTPIITPAPPAGSWHIHTNLQSMLYVPTEAWSLSTQYVVTLPKNACCHWGIPFEARDPSETTISTPTAEVDGFWWPAGSSAEQPVMPTFIVAFKQRVTPADIISKVKFSVTAERGEALKKARKIDAALVPEAQWKENEAIATQAAFYAPGKFVVVQPSAVLPYRASCQVRVLEGFPSAEGPLPATHSASHDFHTVPTFEVVSYAPTTQALVSKDPIFMRFNQPLVKVQLNFVDGDYKLPWTPSIKPKHPGKWTLQRNSTGQLNPYAIKFTPSEPWRKATKYTISLPAGTASLVGETLQFDYNAHSSTPVVELVRAWPADGGQIGRRPFFYFEFDSLVHDADVLAASMLHSKLQADSSSGAHGIPLSVVNIDDALLHPTIAKMVQECDSVSPKSTEALSAATIEPLDADSGKSKKSPKEKSSKKEKSTAAASVPRRWVVLTPTKALMYHDILSLAIVNLQSAEGTLKSTYSYKLKYYVVGPLDAQLASPVAWRQELPSSEMRLAIQFNQPVSLKDALMPVSWHTKELPVYAKPVVVVEPAVSGDASTSSASPVTDSIAVATSSSTSDKVKSSKSKVTIADANQPTVPSPIFEYMGVDGKPVGKPIKLTWLIEDEGKRLVTSVPVSMLPSSQYRLTVPLPATSVYEEKLPEARVFNLHTPTNRIAECYPRPGGIVRDVGISTPVLLRFSQPIDRATILSRLQFYVKKEKSKSLLSGIFGKGKKDDKPYCGAVLMDPEELRTSDAKIKQMLAEWAELNAGHDALALGLSDVVAGIAPAVEESPSNAKKASKQKPTKSGDSDDPTVRTDAKLKEFGSAYSTHYWILVRPERPLPHNSRVNLVVGPALPSLFGPGLSAERKMKLLFNTAPQLEVSATFNVHENSVVFKFNQNMFHDGVQLMNVKDMPWKPLLNVDLPLSLYPTWWIINSTTLKFWVRSWPNSTKYVFMIPPKGATSMLGEQLQDRFTFEFERATMKIVGRLPSHGSHVATVCDPVFALKFNQFVDAKDIAAHCHIYLKGEKTPYCGMEPIRFADALATVKSVRLYGTSSAILRPEQLFEFRQNSAGKVVWLRPKNPLPSEKRYRLFCGPGLPSLEGPLTDPKAVKYSFETVAPFKIASSLATTQTRLQPIYVSVTNNFAEGLMSSDPAIRNRLLNCVTVEPPVPVEKVLCDYGSMRIWLRTDTLNTSKTYKVTLADWLTDSYGQSLAEHIDDPVQNKASRTIEVTFHPIEFSNTLVADMGSYPRDATNLMVTYDPMLLHHGQAAGNKPTFRIQNINFSSLRVLLYKFDPQQDLPKWVKLKTEPTDKEPLPAGMGTLISDSIVNIPELADPLQYGAQVPLDIDLSPALENAEELTGHIGLVVIPPKAAFAPNSGNPPVIRAWIQCTRLAVEVFPTPTMMMAWVHDMVDSLPVKAARVSSVSASVLSKEALKDYSELSSGSTDKNGWVTLEGRPGDLFSRHLIVVKGTDACILQNVRLHVPSSAAGPRIFSQIWNDRGMYRPGETVELKGYIREFRVLPDGTPSFTAPALAEGKEAADDLKELKWTLNDPTGTKVTDGSFVLSPTYGTFHISVPLPASINLGACSISFTGLGPLSVDSQPHLAHRLALNASHTFTVQEFRRPDFVAKSEILEQRPTYLYGEDALVKVEASYFAGGGLGDCDVTWKVASTKASFAAPGWLGYLFSTAKDSLELAHSERTKRPSYDYKKDFAGITDEKGRHAVKIAFKGTPDVCEPVQVVVDIEVLDLNKQALTSQQKLLVHPNRVYLGVKLPDGSQLSGDISSPGGPAGKPLQVLLVAADLDGKLVPDLPIQVRVCKVLTANKEKLQETLETRLVASRAGVPAIYEFDRTKFTQSRLIEAYALVVTMKDPGTSRMSEVVVLLNDPVAVTANSPHAVNATVLAPPPPVVSSPMRPTITNDYSYRYEYYDMKDKADPLVLTPYSHLPIDVIKVESLQPEYKVGEQARIKVTTGLPLPAEAIVIIRGDLGHTILSTQTMSLKEEVSIIEFPITEINAPWTTVHVSAISTMVREGQDENSVEIFRRLAQAEGHLQVPVSSNHRELSVVVQPDDPNVAPGTETEVTVRITGWQSKAVGSTEVALVVIDESVLSMTQHEIPNPFKYFYDPEPMRAYIPAVAQYSLRKGIQLKDIKAVLEDAEKRKRAKIEEIEESEPEGLVPASEDSLEEDSIQEVDDIVPDPEEERLAVLNANVAYEDDEEPTADTSGMLLRDGLDMDMDFASGGGRGGGSRARRLVVNSDLDMPKGASRKKSKAMASPTRNTSSASSPPPPPPASSMSNSLSFGAPPPPPGMSYQSAAPSAPAPRAMLSDEILSAKMLRRSSFAESDSSSEDEEEAWDDDNDDLQMQIQRSADKMEEINVKSDSLMLSGLMMEREMSSEKKRSMPAKNMKSDKMKDSKSKKEKESAPMMKKMMPKPMMSSKSAAPRQSSKRSDDAVMGAANMSSLMMDEMEYAAPMEMDEMPEGGMILAENEMIEEEEEAEELFLRSNFNPLAHFSDAVVVNDQGIAKILVKLPDNLTRYRIWAVAVSAKSSMFGMGESLITASLPLQVRITPPRFLNFNDDAELPIVIQNLRDKSIEVKVGIRAIRAILGVAKAKDESGATESSSKPYNAFVTPDLAKTGFLVEIPANGRRMLTVPIKATKAGVCRFQVSVLQGLFGDAQEVSVSVLAPPTTNSFTFSGSLAGGKQPSAICTDLRVPSDALPEFGSLEVALSTTKLQSLAEPAVYLSYIPYEYTEQRASRVMALGALSQLLEALSGSSKKGRYPNAYSIKATIGSDMLYFKNFQSSDGSFRMWGSAVPASPPPMPGSGPSSATSGLLTKAWLTAQVAQAVAAAREGGFNTHEPLITLFSKSWTQKLESALVTLCEKPLYSKDSDYAPWAAAKCYTIYAYSKLAKDAKKAAKYAETFYKTTSPQTLSVESVGFLLTVFAEAGHELASQLVNYLETAITTYDLETRVSYPDIYSDESRYELFHSRSRTDAVLLEAVVSAKPDSKLVGHLFRGLMRSRVDGKWGNTQDNAFCVVAIHKYFKVFEAVVPDLKARVWLDKDMCVEEAFVGRTTDTRITEIPMSYVLKNPDLVTSSADLVEEKTKKKSKKTEDVAESSESAVVVEESDENGDDDVEDPRMQGKEDEPLQGKALMIHKSGKGRVYYTLKINYSPATLKVPASDCGFTVARHYASPTYVADLTAVTDLLYLREEALWRVKKGTKVRVELVLTVFFPTTFVALVDHLPAGFEPLDIDEYPTREKVLPPPLPNADSSLPVQEDAPRWWAHVNLRDARVEVLADKLTPGTYRFAYIARATMAGHFAAPPARAEELYQPTVFGNTDSTKVEVF